ncbi:hypothetical protein H4Q26_008220 [Puccinia striiformis f. sp. tritici PST-130]|nr:hypothetical protein H4Q26_008220 [Puccinia striiformis f. sp. tritici PST-130]
MRSGKNKTVVGSIEKDTVQNFIASNPELREQGITASLARDQVKLPESAKGREGLGLYKRTCTESPGGWCLVLVLFRRYSRKVGSDRHTSVGSYKTFTGGADGKEIPDDYLQFSSIIRGFHNSENHQKDW